MSTTAAFPLFRAEGGGEPVLIGGRCRKCGAVFFPMQTYGCERCGEPGEGLEAADLAGRGRLVAYSQVNLHAQPSPPTPFTAVVIRLDDGPTIRALLDPPVDAGLKAGQRMQARLVMDGEAEVVRFARAEA